MPHNQDSRTLTTSVHYEFNAINLWQTLVDNPQATLLAALHPTSTCTVCSLRINHWRLHGFQPSLAHASAPVTCEQSYEVGHISWSRRLRLMLTLQAYFLSLRLHPHRNRQPQHPKELGTSASPWRTSGTCPRLCARRYIAYTSSRTTQSPTMTTRSSAGALDPTPNLR
jgi:hypothetical protein